MTRAAGRRLGVRDTQLPRYEHEQKTRISDLVSCGGGDCGLLHCAVFDYGSLSFAAPECSMVQ